MYVFSKTETFAKLFFLISFTGLLTYVVLAFYTFHTAFTTVTQLRKIQERVKNLPDPDLSNVERSDNDLKYILLWSTENGYVQPMGEGQHPFIDRNCSFVNCFLTADKELLNGNYVNFDSIIIDIPVLKSWKLSNLPLTRSPKQKYVFYGNASSAENPICNVRADNYFNWTWSYKLYSDIFSPFIEVRDLKGNIVAPSIKVEWVPNMQYPTKQETDNLMVRNKIIAWKINNCETTLNRMQYADELKYELKEQNITFDIYGCDYIPGHLPCRKGSCLKFIKEYMYYLVYEDSIAEDYITDEVLKAYNNGAVPVVISGADYTKTEVQLIADPLSLQSTEIRDNEFLPPGSYINARLMSAAKLAAIIDYSMRIPIVYAGFHRWRNHYTIHPVDKFKGLCQLCNYLNNKNMVQTFSHYQMFRKWWFMGPLKEHCYPKTAEKFTDVLSYINGSKLFGKRRSNTSI